MQANVVAVAMEMPLPNNLTVKFQEEEDLPYEEEIIRSPYSVKFWMRYIEHKAKKGSNTALNLLYERALKELPGR